MHWWNENKNHLFECSAQLEEPKKNKNGKKRKLFYDKYLQNWKKLKVSFQNKERKEVYFLNLNERKVEPDRRNVEVLTKA